jgi:serine/threonine protein kinase
MEQPEPLSHGAIIGDRFEVHKEIGRGGFGVVYLVEDRLRGDFAVMKELAPPGAKRLADGSLTLEHLGQEASLRLRQRFVEEGQNLARVRLRGVVGYRTTVHEQGAAYLCTDYYEGAKTLDTILAERSRLTWGEGMELLDQLVETLEGVHARGLLHRDLKPSNILVTSLGEAMLIDFGAAREWHCDRDKSKTVTFTPAYAPPEQMSDSAKRSPATDIYSLCATMWHAWVGGPPPTPAERLSGIALPRLSDLLPEADPRICKAIEQGLSLQMGERPASVAIFKEMLASENVLKVPVRLSEINTLLTNLRELRLDRRLCPGCQNSILDRVHPIKKNRCPVCRAGFIRKREFDSRYCPSCRVSPLRRVENDSGLDVCPICNEGLLKKIRKSILKWREAFLQCQNCDATFEAEGDMITLFELGDHRSPVPILTRKESSEWRAMTGRMDALMMCDGCSAMYDILPDGRWKQVLPRNERRGVALHKDEWSRIAAGFEPNCGNFGCTDCEADYFVEGETVTLLSYDEDPHGFGEAHLGRLLTFEQIRWLAVGKESTANGFVCADCGTEMDLEGDNLQLIQSTNRKLIPFLGQTKPIEDWHRLGRGLPSVEEEEAFLSQIDDALRDAYRQGEFKVYKDENTLWSGLAVDLASDQRADLTVRTTGIEFGGMLRKERIPMSEIAEVSGEGNRLEITLTESETPVVYEVEPEQVVVELPSSERKIILNAEDIAGRLHQIFIKERSRATTGRVV